MSASRFAMINTLVTYALGGYKPRQCTVSDYMNCLFGNNAEYQRERLEFKIRNNYKGINEIFIIWAFENIWPKIAQEGEPKTIDEIIERYEIEDCRKEPVKTNNEHLDLDLFEEAGLLTGQELYRLVKNATQEAVKELLLTIIVQNKE